MKKLMLSVIFFSCVFIGKAQDEDDREESTGGFKKENLFTGGNVNASFFNGTTALGVTPYFGYSITNWLDAAVSLNFNYISQRDVYTYGDKERQTIVGPGAFVRVFPVKFLFAQAQFEHNFLTQKYIQAPNSSYTRDKFTTDVNSLLLGIGYASGREAYNKSYYYISLSFDVLKLANSPYVDNLQRGIPIINAGFNIALFQGGGRR
ncbi:MAG: hypothetical protein JWP81_1673 [Ferruginibacter sp.]|nr:hypothetical protein [Ferruginibacter sp.]